MTLDFFLNNYDYKNLTIKNVEFKNNYLLLDIHLNSHLDLIANGYRPALDVELRRKFVFEVQDEIKNISAPFELDFIKIKKNYYISINQVKSKLLSQNINVLKTK